LIFAQIFIKEKKAMFGPVFAMAVPMVGKKQVDKHKNQNNKKPKTLWSLKALYYSPKIKAKTG
jgi:hypothetical protein